MHTKPHPLHFETPQILKTHWDHYNLLALEWTPWHTNPSPWPLQHHPLPLTFTNSWSLHNTRPLHHPDPFSTQYFKFSILAPPTNYTQLASNLFRTLARREHIWVGSSPSTGHVTLLHANHGCPHDPQETPSQSEKIYTRICIWPFTINLHATYI